MSWRLKVRALRNRQLRRDLEDELGSHIEMVAEALEADGWPPDAALREARRRFGSVNQITESTRELHVFTFLETLLQDIRYGLRRLRHEPVFTLVAVLTLGLVIGANGAMFSLMEAVLLRPLPFAKPDQLVAIWGRTGQEQQQPLAALDLEDYAKARSLSAVTPTAGQSVNLTGIDEPTRLFGGFVSSAFFRMLDTQASLGRVFSVAEDTDGAPRVCVLSHGAWQDRFGADPQILGRALLLNGEPHTVIGILPESFRPPFFIADVWMPIQSFPNYRRNREALTVRALGRVADGATLAQAGAELATISGQLAAQYPDTNHARGAYLVPLHEQLVGGTRQTVLVLVGAVACVLLIGCANVAGLLLTKAVGRKQEMALRASLGAGSGRLIRQLLTESLLLAFGGGALGLALAAGGMALINAFWGDLLGLTVLTLNATVVGYLLAVSTGTGLLFGLAPAFLARRQTAASSLRQRGTAAVEGHLRSLLVAGQVALALVLLIGAGLMMKSVARLAGVDPGFRGDRVLTLEYRVPRNKYPTGEQQAQFHHAVLERVAALPGVQSAGLVRVMPFSGNSGSIDITLPDRPDPPREAPFTVAHAQATPGYFQTLGIPLLEGRDFALSDTARSAPVVIVSRAFVQRFWPGERGLGRQVRLPIPPPSASSAPPRSSLSGTVPASASSTAGTGAGASAAGAAAAVSTVATIVGVVGDTKTALYDADAPQLYVPYAQQPFIFAALAVRTAGDPMAMTASVRRAVWAVDKDQPMWKIRTLQSLVEQSFSARRYTVFLLTGFSALALLLAALGLYGVLAYAVSQRTAEFGVRMAIGATPAQIVRLVIGKGVALALAGLAGGLAASLLLTRYLSSQVYDVSTHDPVVYASLSLLLLIVALLAVLLPARRAMRVDPVIALRHQ